MGITLTGKTINSTYDSLLKLLDNDSLTGAFKVITDGLGNDTGISVNDNGDVVISNTLAVNTKISTPLLQFTGGTGTQGTMSWNPDKATVDLILNGFSLPIGHQVVFHVKNNSVTTAIPLGTPVYVAGTLGASGIKKVAPFIADGSINAKYFLGVTSEIIAADGEGKVTWLGDIKGFDTLTYGEGVILYPSETVAGGWQTTKPTAPNPKLEVAFTVNAKSNGTITVRGNNGHYLSDLHDVQFSALSNQDLQVYNSTSQRWENSKTIGDLTAANLTATSFIKSGGTSSQFLKADGSVDSTTYQDTTEKGQALGYAPLDSGAKIAEAYLPDSVLGQVEYQGTWNATLNSPTLPDPTTVKGHFYIVSTAGTYLTIDYQVGDWVISNGVDWSKVDNTDAVTTFNGRLGSIVPLSADYDSFFYTKTLLDAGQLDNRYYTEAELDAGQLDNRYYTETELNAGQLDTRYYTETEIGNFFSGTTAISGYNKSNWDSVFTAYNNGDFDLQYITDNGATTTNTITINTSSTGQPLILKGVVTTVGSIPTELQFYGAADGTFSLENHTGSTYGQSGIDISSRETQFGGIRLYQGTTTIGDFKSDGIDLITTEITGTLDVSGTTTLAGTTYLESFTYLKETVSILDANGSSYSTVIYRDGINPHVLMAGGGTSTQWNSAYTYSQVGHLPLSGGTVTGNLTVNGDVSSDVFKSSTYPTSSFLDFNDDQTLNANMTTLSSIGGLNLIWDSNNNDSATFSIWDANPDVDLATERFQIDGSGNARFFANLTVDGTITGNGSGLTSVNATTLDSLDSSQFLRSDTSDTAAGKIVFTASAEFSGAVTSGNGIRLGTYVGGVGITAAGDLVVGSDGKSNWQNGDELGRIRFYSTDASGIGARDAAIIKAVNTSTGGTTFNGELAFYTSAYNASATEKVRIDDVGNVGIGTTSPSQTLDVNGKIRVQSWITGVTNNNTLYSSTGTGTLLQSPSTTGTASKIFIRRSDSAVTATFDTENERLGIGTTSPSERLHILGGKVKLQSSSNGHGWIYAEDTNHSIVIRGNRDGISGNYTSYYQYGSDYSAGGGHKFYTGGPIGSQTLRMTIANDYTIFETGNVGIGTTSPQGKFTTVGTYATVTHSYASNDAISITSTGVNGSGYNAFTIGQANSPNNVGVMRFKYVASGSTSNYLGIGFYANDDIFTIKANKNVGIGTNNPDRELDLVKSTDNCVMSITSGTTNISGLVLGDTADDDRGGMLYNNTSEYLYFLVNAGEGMRLTSTKDLHVDGNIVGYSTTISDKRLKDEVATIDNALEKIKSLRGVSYVWNNGSRKGRKDLGLIAQEVEKVLPEIVYENEMPLMDDSGKKYKTVDYEKMVGVLIEAVKEQQLQIDELKAQLK